MNHDPRELFKLKSPCVSCPFRKGKGSYFGLGKRRLESIRTASAFTCHQTVDYSGDDPEQDTPNQRYCAGRMAVLAREKTYDLSMCAGVRFGFLNVEELDPRKEAYESWADVQEAHAGGIK